MATQTLSLQNEKVNFNPETNTAQAIPVDQLKAVPSIQLPTYNPDPSKVDGLVSSIGAVSPTIDNFIQTLTPQETQLDKSQNNIINRINELLPQSGGRQQAMAQEQINQGIPELRRQLQDYNNQITAGNAELAKMEAENLNKLSKLEINPEATTGFVTRQQAETNRQYLYDRSIKAAELGVKAALAQAAAGNINTALQIAQNAVEARYAPIEDELKIRQAQLNSIQPLLDKQQKEQALKQQLLIDERKRVLEVEKEKEKQVSQIMLQAAQVGADQGTLDRIKNSSSLGEAIKNSGDYLSAEFKQKVEQQKFENNIKLQELNLSRARIALEKKKIDQEENNQDIPGLVAYAQQYASTGQIPTGLPKGTFGSVAEIAKSLPKPDGTLVDVNTGIKPSKLSSTQVDGITALYDLQKKIDEAKDLFNSYNQGLAAGVKNKIFPSQEKQKYNNLKSEIVDLLARARTGAVLSKEEEETYSKKLPGDFNKFLFLGSNGNTSIDSLKKSLDGKLDATLKVNGVSIYGYSKVKLGDGKDYMVGSIINNGQDSARVNPDGTLTLVDE